MAVMRVGWIATVGSILIVAYAAFGSQIRPQASEMILPAETPPLIGPPPDLEHPNLEEIPALVADPILPYLGEDGPASQFALEVSADANSGGVGENIARLLTAKGLPATQARIDYFRANLPPGSADVTGWRGALASATETPDGIVATLRVYASYSLKFDNLHLVESYLINDQEVQFIEARLPAPQPRSAFH